jgi:hypothetical protein
MATADEYAQWIVDNEDKKGTEAFNTVVQAYQEAKAAEAPKQTEPDVADNLATGAGMAAAGNFSPANLYGMTLGEAGQAIKTGAQAAANRVGQTTLGGAGTLAADAYAALHGLPPLASMGRKVLQSVMPGSQTTIAEGLGQVGQALKTGAGGLANAGKFIAQGAVAPENLLTLPYQMAAYEQAKIRQNPNAAGLQYNPYAQTVRGEAPTQRAAGAMNQRTALASMPITGVTPDQRAILEEDQRRKLALMTQVAAAKKIIGFGQ